MPPPYSVERLSVEREAVTAMRAWETGSIELARELSNDAMHGEPASDLDYPDPEVTADYWRAVDEGHALATQSPALAVVPAPLDSGEPH